MTLNPINWFIWYKDWLWRFFTDLAKAKAGYYAKFLAFLAMALAGLTLMKSLTVKMIAIMAGFFANANSAGGDPCPPGWLVEMCALGNTFFPLGECFQLLASMILVIWLPLFLYRLVKSWLPGIGGAGT